MPQCHQFQSAIRRLVVRVSQERGQALVEFAIVLPVLLMIILGIIYFGRYEDYNNQETQLSEQGARLAAVGNLPSPTLQAYIQAQAQPELANGSPDVTPVRVWIYQPAGNGGVYKVGQSIRVCVVSTVTFPTLIASPTATMAQAATMRVETVPNTWTLTGSTPYDSTNPSGTRPSECPSA